ncbi:type II toxin-antitoxin system PrlF family antitoxin [Polynucleobacter brandtiae]
MMPTAVLETESTLTDRYQTTVPEPIRQALKLGKRDKVHYAILDNGEVLLSRGQETKSDDPVLGHFLHFLSHDLTTHPERLQALDSAWVERLQLLVGKVQFDLEAPLPDDEA